MENARVCLRPAMASDADAILRWENDPEFWPLTAYPGPFTRRDIEQFIRNSKDLRHAGQQRWMICEKLSQSPIGAVDLFTSARIPHTVGIGILIGEKSFRGAGYGSESLALMMKLIRNELRMNGAECLIDPDNTPSIRLFERQGFHKTGTERFRQREVLRYYIAFTTA
jgi:diamine N-acetyltransferase